MLNESKIRGIVGQVILEYNKWFQSEENDIHQVIGLMREVKDGLNNINSLSPEEVWEVVRKLAYINHSAFKVRPGTWDLYPDELLDDDDYRLNKLVYAFKEKALDALIDYYIENGLDITTNETNSMVVLRDPITGHRQITFHMKKDSEQAARIADKSGVWDGVRMAHHFENDQDYDNARNCVGR